MATLQAVLPLPLAFAPGAGAGVAALRTVFAAPVTARLATGRAASGQPYVGGYAVAGTVTISAAPAARKVRLYLLNTGQLVAETWSDPVTGAYRFEQLELAEYYVWSEDYARNYDPVSHLVPISPM